MANFIGTETEFKKYIGPYLRNLIQTSISKKYKKEIGKCEICGTKKGLQAAHKHDKNRQILIEKAIKESYVDNNLKVIDLEKFETIFTNLHKPEEETFFILCAKCHRDYDKNNETEFEELKALNEMKKVEARFSNWLTKPDQQNTIVLNAFFENQKDYRIKIETLKMNCNVNNFESVLNNLTNINANNYGKVFDILEDEIVIWDRVKDFIIEQYDNSKR
jgi:hypothetical protein